MSYFIHPNLPPVDGQATILNLKTGEFSKDHPVVELPEGHRFSNSFEEYFKDLSRMTELRKALKIPPMTYHAHYFPRMGYSRPSVMELVEWARERYETRWWVNYTSAILLICIADTELGEDAGWDFFKFGENMPTRKGFGCPAWWEFCQMGTRIPLEWDLAFGLRDNVIATSPDKQYGMVIGD